MGCDIHFYTEKRVVNTPQTLLDACLQKITRLPNVNLTILPPDLKDRVSQYQDKPYWKFIHETAYREHQVVVKSYEDRGEYCPYYKSFADYCSRNYDLFGILANVRTYVEFPIADSRGIPDDVSLPIQEEYTRM
jgi:hypothetical protein